MTFPQTRHSLIQRLATTGDDRDWQVFLGDYWGPVCRFAGRSGRLTAEDAEDAAALVFAALIQNRLLERWLSQPSAKLRTLLCAVVRNVLANRARVESGRARLIREHGGRLDHRAALPVLPTLDASAEEVDLFYGAWVEEILQETMEKLLIDYHQEGRGDFFRVLYGRLCDGMIMPEIAQALNLTVSQAENAYKHVRKRLSQLLEERVREHVNRYCRDDGSEGEFAAEWNQLAEYLKDHGGLEEAVRRAFMESPAFGRGSRSAASIRTGQQRVKAILGES